MGVRKSGSGFWALCLWTRSVRLRRSHAEGGNEGKRSRGTSLKTEPVNPTHLTPQYNANSLSNSSDFMVKLWASVGKVRFSTSALYWAKAAAMGSLIFVYCLTNLGVKRS